MLKAQPVQPGPPGVRLALQGMGLMLLALLLIPLAGPKGFLFGAGGILAILGAVWVIKQPYWGVLVLEALAIIDIDPVGISYLSLPYVTSALLLIPLALRSLRNREIWVWRVPQIQILLAIGLLFLISTAWSNFKYEFVLAQSDRDFTGRFLLIFFSRLGFLVFFLYFVNTKQRIEFTTWWVIGLIIIITLDALHFFVETGMTRRSQASFSLAENSNRLAFISIFATSLVWFYRAYSQSPRLKALSLPLLFFFPLSALSAGSRSGFLQLGLLAAFIVKEQTHWRIAKQIRVLFLLSAVSVSAFLFIPDHILSRLTNMDPATASEQGKDSLYNRVNTDLAALAMGLDNPFLGVGIGNFVWVKQHFYGLGRGSNPHNSYLWALTGGGLGVLILYLLLFFVTYRMLRQLERAGPLDLLWLSKALKVNLFLFLLFSFFADVWLNDFLYFTIGTTVCMTNLWQSQRRYLQRSFSPPQRHHQPLPQPSSSPLEINPQAPLH